jgi:hypothetical protein
MVIMIVEQDVKDVFLEYVKIIMQHVQILLQAVTALQIVV